MTWDDELNLMGLPPQDEPAQATLTPRQAFRLAFGLVRADRSADLWGLGETTAQRSAANAFYAELNRVADYRARDAEAIERLARALDAAQQVAAR